MVVEFFGDLHTEMLEMLPTVHEMDNFIELYDETYQKLTLSGNESQDILGVNIFDLMTVTNL